MKSSSKWILRSQSKDLLCLYLPGLVVILITYLFNFPRESKEFAVFAWVALVFLDTGHVYSTIWRTYLNKIEFKRIRKIYILTPLAVFIFFSLWIFSGFKYLGVFIAYVTIYHNIRQFYGVSKWYQKINNTFDVVSDRFLYLLCTIPFVGAHFKTNLEWASYYENAGAFLSPSYFLEKLFLIIWLLSLGVWVLYELFKSKKRGYEIPRILSVLFPAVLYGYCFLYSTTITGILFPLVVSHGFSYLMLVGVSVERTKNPHSNKLFYVLIFVSAALFGSLEYLFEDEFYSLSSHNFVGIAATALVLTPLFCHYIYDAFLWRSDHPDSKAVIS